MYQDVEGIYYRIGLIVFIKIEDILIELSDPLEVKLMCIRIV
ncbi:hypothetical protein FP76_gp074 [Bacillus phage Evoli]|uniref:Uncharacterized protein n=1 Tax=Bacillus phage Evoli TaxID=1486658 RepID=A0A024B1D0_9CAUD|nr:hypothetical protein FP76_gp074 [Bacillus phage Evoli]AHZ09798.1 hypothetical protein [Bacillus phage Evoli]